MKHVLLGDKLLEYTNSGHSRGLLWWPHYWALIGGSIIMFTLFFSGTVLSYHVALSWNKAECVVTNRTLRENSEDGSGYNLKVSCPKSDGGFVIGSETGKHYYEIGQKRTFYWRETSDGVELKPVGSVYSGLVLGPPPVVLIIAFFVWIIRNFRPITMSERAHIERTIRK